MNSTLVWKEGRIDLFSLQVLFSHCRPRDVSLESCSFNVVICTCTCVHNWWKGKKQIPLRTSHGLNWGNKTYKKGLLWIVLNCHCMDLEKCKEKATCKPEGESFLYVLSQLKYIYYLLTESEIITGKSQTGDLMYWVSHSEVNTSRTRFEISL